MVRSEAHLYKFGEFHLDTLKRVLFHDDTRIQLSSRAFDVLLALVEHNHSVIDKDELIQLVWGERAVEENNLTRHISTLRKVLAESPTDHRYIVTVPGRGYTFVADVERLSSGNGENGSDTENSKVIETRAAGANGFGTDQFESVTSIIYPGQATSTAVTAEPLRLAAPARSFRRHWLWATASVVALAGLAVLSYGVLHTRSKPKTAAANSYRDWEIIRLTRTGGSIIPAISRDGRFVAYVSRESGHESLWILQLATSVGQQILPPEKYAYFDLDFTPDGSQLFFTRREGQAPQRALYRIPMLGGIAKKLRDDIDSQVTVSPDGAHLAFSRLGKEGKSEFILASIDGVEERVLAKHALQFPEWSPDGSVIAYSVGNAGAGGENMGIYEVRVADGVQREISLKKWIFVGNKSWLPDGSGLIVTGRQRSSNVTQLWFLSYSSGESWPLSDGFSDFERARLTDDGRAMVAEQLWSVCDIWTGPLADVAQGRKIGVWGRAGLSFDASGGRVVYSSLQSGEVFKIWTMNVDGTSQKQLTADNGSDIAPVASPDGRYIVFCSNRSGNHEIWRVNYDGSNLVQLTHTRGATWPAISPDSKWLFYLSATDSILYRVSIEGGEPQRITDKAIGASAISPNGKLIAYFVQGKEAWEIAVSAVENGSFIKRFRIGSHSLNNASLEWTSDGNGLLYAANADGVGNIWMQPLDGSAPNRITDFKEDGIFSFDISRHGKDLVTARGGWKHDLVFIRNLR